jgi:enoyl-[acyl-carrier-protein] reductase (NADH)
MLPAHRRPDASDMNMPFRPLGGQRVLIVGDLGEHSGAWRAARQASGLGARLALLSPSAAPSCLAAAAQMDAWLRVGDIAQRAALEAMVDSAAAQLGGFDLVVHSINWAPSAAAGCDGDDAIEHHLQRLRASCRSFTELARLCAARMAPGASLVRLDHLHAAGSSLSSDLMQAVQAVLDSILRYLALELRPWGLAVHGVSSASMAQPASNPFTRGPCSMRVGRAALAHGMTAHDMADGFMALLGAAAATGRPGRTHQRVCAAQAL